MANGRSLGASRAWLGILCIACGSCNGCPELECPYAVSLSVSTATGGELTGLTATVSGQPLSCRATRWGATCDGGGDGRLHLEAPGFQPVDVDSTVTETPASRCGCPDFTREPSTVVLEPALSGGAGAAGAGGES